MNNKNLLLIIVLITLLNFVKSSDLSYKKVHLVDSIELANGNTNYFFRGNQPTQTLSNGTKIFPYDELVEFLRNSSLSEFGVKLPEQFYIIDIKLISGPLPSELPDLELEQNFFAANPTLGESRTNQTWGDIIDPQLVPQDKLEEYASTISSWSADKLPQRMRDYHNILLTERELPTVLYVHCECGCDRTGEVMASYVMKFKGWDLPKALEWDFAIAGRDINFSNRWSAQWYCLYLNYVENYKLDCNQPTPPPKSLISINNY
ncbi:hypothetical protein DDB_G0285459 [Dictyostelium discoideum AX4]|uniref:Tyrosine specific protein phosphatases domain-containing protein n=1 Tax=Dictyostelium discoideum TaxID=44689 RepID=Q54N75_DICDI|nr:hypothetical protein DDB_G0285459 [Dictyostelium discoideum AX4]EAL64567.1 hypothetical protein DDB_G0285459 [Dictyostelium discoideum AX4]|eukprot:XP_638068.1 hypothetical protein DDB_G0285459 [Dictyostelium discoideum AX4]